MPTKLQKRVILTREIYVPSALLEAEVSGFCSEETPGASPEGFPETSSTCLLPDYGNASCPLPSDPVVPTQPPEDDFLFPRWTQERHWPLMSGPPSLVLTDEISREISLELFPTEETGHPFTVCCL